MTCSLLEVDKGDKPFMNIPDSEKLTATGNTDKSPSSVGIEVECRNYLKLVFKNDRKVNRFTLQQKRASN